MVHEEGCEVNINFGYFKNYTLSYETYGSKITLTHLNTYMYMYISMYSPYFFILFAFKKPSSTSSQFCIK